MKQNIVKCDYEDCGALRNINEAEDCPKCYINRIQKEPTKGLKYKRPTLSPDYIKFKGLTIPQIAKKLGRTAEQIKYRLMAGKEL